MIVDLCAGSGALGLAVAARIPGATLVAAELDPVAAGYATRNLAGIGDVVVGDLFDPVPVALQGRVDLLIVNAPYVPTGEVGLLPPEARDHEPLATLDGGADGLDLHRRVAAEASGWLCPGGALLTETSERQAFTASAIFAAHGFAARTMDDIVTVAVRPR